MKAISLFILICCISLVYQKMFLKDIKIRKFASTDLETIRNNLLTRHNYYREIHQVDNLSRNSEIETIAQNYSEYLTENKKFEHSGNKYNGLKLGENLYMKYGSYQVSVTGTDAVDSWYSEVSYYNFSNPGYSSEAGHFTQLVWKESKDLGCGASCQNNACVVTCNYYPPGNVIGLFSSNVFPAKNSESESNSKNNQITVLNEKTGMSTAGKVFLSIFIILIVIAIAFTVYHFAYRKRNFNELKNYFKIKG